MDTSSTPPQLNGRHVRITVIEEGGFLQISQSQSDGSLEFKGYLIDMLKAIAREDRANFTYDLLTPSGFGPSCIPQQQLAHAAAAAATVATVTRNNTSEAHSNEESIYSATYHTQYNCGSDDVHSDQKNNSTAAYATDMYLGMYYITPERQLLNQFPIPFVPPNDATPAMWGTATRVRTIRELILQQQQKRQKPVCMLSSTALLEVVQNSYPALQIKQVLLGESLESYFNAFDSGECEINIVGAPIAAQLVLRLSQQGMCRANGKPIGLIGEPMKSGLKHYAIGIRRDAPTNVADTLSYWTNVLMTNKAPVPKEISRNLFENQVGVGDECGYVLFPRDRRLSDGVIVAITFGIAGAIALIFAAWHRYQVREQQARFKERFVQQIARNIEIGPSPGDISAVKLSEEILHIGKGKDRINKKDLGKWLFDIKMNFISKEDFEALWDAMDIGETGQVDPVEFIVFLSSCGREFEKLYNEQRKLPRIERLKLAARRLTNLSTLGERGVRSLEYRLDRKSRGAAPSNINGSSTRFMSSDVFVADSQNGPVDDLSVERNSQSWASEN